MGEGAVKKDKKPSKNKEAKPEGKSKQEVGNLAADKTVLIGFTGRADSMVAAYLLKKQGYKVIAMAIELYDPNSFWFDFDPLLPAMADAVGYLESKELAQALKPYCHIENIEDVKKLADLLEIEFYGAKGTDYFQEYIMEPMIAAKLAGRQFYPCTVCHTITLRILKDKAKLLGATKIATGHFCKVTYSPKNKIYSLACSGDKTADQSYLLSLAGQDILESLILPLAATKKEEVLKIVKTMGWPVILPEKKQLSCFSNCRHFAELIDRVVPLSMRKAGQVLKYTDETFVSEHDGIHHYALGQKPFPVKGQAIKESSMEVALIEPHSANVFVIDSNLLKTKELVITEFTSKPLSDISKPFRCYVQIGSDMARYLCIFKPKSLSAALLSFEVELPKLIGKGTPVFVYDKEEIGKSKLIGAGIVHDFPEINPLAQVKKSDDDDELEDEKAKKKKDAPKEIEF